MKSLDRPERIQGYLREVLTQVRAVELHRDIREEIGNHLEELAEDLVNGSPDMNRDQAIQHAITQMGDPSEVGKRLNRIHRPRTDWFLVSLLILFLGASFVIMYSADQSMKALTSAYSFHLFEKKILYVILGACLLLGIRLFDYRKLLLYSRPMYGGMLGLMILTLWMGRNVNGRRHYLELFNFSLDFISLSVFILIIVLCGLLSSSLSGQAKEPWWKLWLTYVFPPVLLYALNHDYMLILLYVSVAYILFARSYTNGMFRFGVPLMHLAGLVVALSRQPYMQDRLISYLNPYSDPQGSSYMIFQSLKTIHAAGWLGNGVGVPSNTLPGIYSDMLFPYVVSVFGWIGGSFVAWIAFMLLLRIAKAAQTAADPYGILLIKGIGSLFGLKFLWSIGMTLGWLPIMSIQLPFLGSGGFSTPAEMAMIGLLMSIYRRKDMIRRTISRAAAQSNT